MALPSWRDYDGLESRQATIGGAVVDFLAHATEKGLITIEQHNEVMEAAQVLTDRMRRVTRTAQQVVIDARGYRP